ncbi:MAG TPA: hypothetical protein VF528_02765 [Pyrinomonadaceae bacterium]|jgi:hypothetical protein
MIFSDLIKAALLAIGGFFVTQLSLHIAEWIKASREWKKAQRERQMTLKRELYLPIIEALTEIHHFFLAIPQVHYSKFSELKMPEKAQKSLAVQYIIANDPIMIAINNVSRQIAESIMRLMVLKMDEAKLAMEFDHLTTRIKELSGDNRLILDRMKELREAGTLTAEIAASLHENFQRNQSEYQQLYDEQQKKFVGRNNLTKGLYVQTMKEVVELARLSAPVIIEIRRDLGIPTNEETIVNQYKASINFVEQTLPGYVKEVFQKAAPETSG